MKKRNAKKIAKREREFDIGRGSGRPRGADNRFNIGAKDVKKYADMQFVDFVPAAKDEIVYLACWCEGYDRAGKSPRYWLEVERVVAWAIRKGPDVDVDKDDYAQKFMVEPVLLHAKFDNCVILYPLPGGKKVKELEMEIIHDTKEKALKEIYERGKEANKQASAWA
jgi:hypothetical protein